MINNSKILFGSILIIIYCFAYQNLYAQSSPTTKESIDWINDKFKTYTTTTIKIQIIELEESGLNSSVKVLTLSDARGDNSVMFLTKQFVNIDHIENIRIRREEDFIAIDITPKTGRNCGVILHPMWGKSFDYNFALEFIKNDYFPITEFDPFPFFQISLKKSSENDKIPDRMVIALKNILKNNGITIKDELF